MSASRGFSLAEILVVVVLLALTILAVVPAAAGMLSGSRTAAAARHVALTFQALRFKSVATNRAHGLLFEQDVTGWLWYEVQDGNGNGLRTAEVRRGIDRVLSGPHRLEERISRVTLGFPDTGPIPAIPPRGGAIDALDDPIKFGNTDLVSFSPLGRSSSGTVYLTDGRLGLYGIVLFGPTARVRVWRYAVARRSWSL